MNELFDNINGKPAVRAFIGSGEKQITLDSPSGHEFTVSGDTFEILATTMTLTRVTLERKVGDGFVIVKHWYANRQPYKFNSMSGKFRITANQSSAQIIIKGVE